MIWFTSDLHFGHDREFMWGPRGFKSIQEHDEWIIKNWNTVVAEDDEVYVLGDLMLNDNEHGLECINKLNGNIHVILGNHDSEVRRTLYWGHSKIVVVMHALELKVGKNYFYLSHYPTITANYDDDKPWAKHLINLYGHTHMKNKFYELNGEVNPYMYNVSLDAHNNFPVSLDQILEDIKNKKIELDRKEK